MDGRDYLYLSYQLKNQSMRNPLQKALRIRVIACDYPFDTYSAQICHVAAKFPRDVEEGRGNYELELGQPRLPELQKRVEKVRLLLGSTSGFKDFPPLMFTHTMKGPGKESLVIEVHPDYGGVNQLQILITT
jgi:hypothetical protein